MKAIGPFRGSRLFSSLLDDLLFPILLLLLLPGHPICNGSDMAFHVIWNPRTTSSAFRHPRSHLTKRLARLNAAAPGRTVHSPLLAAGAVDWLKAFCLPVAPIFRSFQTQLFYALRRFGQSDLSCICGNPNAIGRLRGCKAAARPLQGFSGVLAAKASTTN